MKTLIAIAAIAAAFTSLASTADAKGKGRYIRVYVYETYDEQPARYAPPSARYESHDDIRAKQYDPTGQYAAYPSWARAALGKSGRR